MQKGQNRFPSLPVCFVLVFPGPCSLCPLLFPILALLRPGLERGADGGRRQPLAQGGENAAGDEDEFRSRAINLSGFSGLSSLFGLSGPFKRRGPGARVQGRKKIFLRPFTLNPTQDGVGFSHDGEPVLRDGSEDPHRQIRPREGVAPLKAGKQKRALSPLVELELGGPVLAHG